MKVEQRDIKFTYHFSRGNKTMKSLLENSVCQERTSSCQGQRGQENIQPDVSDRRGKKPYPNAVSAVSRAFVANGFDVFFPEWLLFVRKSFNATPLEALESSEGRTPSTHRSPVTGPLPGSQGEPLQLGPLCHQDPSWPASQHRGQQVPSLKGAGWPSPHPPQGAHTISASQEAPSRKFSSNPTSLTFIVYKERYEYSVGGRI